MYPTETHDLCRYFEDCERELGTTAELCVSARLIGSQGDLRVQVNFNADQRCPMASIVKIPIGMAFASIVGRGAASFEDRLEISARIASPGPPRNALDRLYFSPWNIVRRETLDRLFTLMLAESDNTAADAVLRYLGGIHAVRDFLNAIRIDQIHIERTISELLTYYYDLELSRSSGHGFVGVLRKTNEIATTIRRMARAYDCRRLKEQRLVENREDCCTPRSMTKLLEMISSDPQYERVYSNMRHCLTGKNRIPAGISGHAHLVRSLAHKTGSLGGIANDVGIIEFRSDDVMLVSVMIWKSTVPLALRERKIAEITDAIIAQYKTMGVLHIYARH